MSLNCSTILLGGMHRRMLGSSKATQLPHQYHCTAAPSSLAEAPIIWSSANGSKLVNKIPAPIVVSGSDKHSRTNPTMGVQLNCSMMKTIMSARSPNSDRMNPAVMARYLPSQESATQPVIGINTQRAEITQSYTILRSSGRASFKP